MDAGPLPRADFDPRPLLCSAAVREAPPGKASPGRLHARERARRVLIVEDEFVSAIGLSRTVEDWGLTSYLAKSPGHAEAMAREVQPGLAVIDINLSGGFEGIDLGRRLQAESGTVVVYVTAYALDRIRDRLRGLRRSAIVFKPVARETLAHAILAAAGPAGP